MKSFLFGGLHSLLRQHNMHLITALTLATTWVTEPASATQCDKHKRFLLDRTTQFIETFQDSSSQFNLHIQKPGILVLEHHAPFGSPSTVIDLVNKDCGFPQAADATFIDNSEHVLIMRIAAPGSYSFRLRRTAVSSGAEHRLHIRFSEVVALPVTRALKSIDEWDEDDETFTQHPVDPEPRSDPPTMTSIDEWDEDDETLTASPGRCSRPSQEDTLRILIEEPGILAAESASGPFLTSLEEGETLSHPRAAGRSMMPVEELLAPVRAGWYLLRWRTQDASCGPSLTFFPLCGLPGSDDHGDSSLCASSIALDTPASADLYREGSADVDVFSFDLLSKTDVRIETEGAIDTFGQLSDGTGRLIIENDDGGYGGNFRIQAELLPGQYFVRVTGADSAEGSLQLTASEH